MSDQDYLTIAILYTRRRKSQFQIPGRGAGGRSRPACSPGIGARLDRKRIPFALRVIRSAGMKPPVDQETAIERCKNGDREAFGLIVQKYMKPAYYVALGYVGTPDDA